MSLLKDKLPGRHWLMLAFTIILVGIVAVFVDLKPQVGVNFFFSSNDPQFQQSAKIDRIFPSGSPLIISVASPRISSEHYLGAAGTVNATAPIDRNRHERRKLSRRTKKL
ncbi:MAG: hypothetical protein ACR2JB_13475 [Bryobacteraceae bacterium]